MDLLGYSLNPPSQKMPVQWEQDSAAFVWPVELGGLGTIGSALTENIRNVKQ